MIVPNVRASFGPEDVGFLLQSLSKRTGRDRRYWEDRLTEEGLDALLDHDEALPSVLEGGGVSPVPPSLVFYLMVRHALLEGGLDDPVLADYVAALLVEFGQGGRAFRIAPYDDRSYRYLIDLVADIEEENSQRRQFLLRAHLGNYSLWLAGLFPDYVIARVHRHGAPALRYYEDLGATGYLLASECELAGRFDLVSLYRDCSERFRDVRRALNRLSDHNFFPMAASPVDRLLRQVVDGMELD